MPFVFKSINKSDISLTENVLHKNQSLDSGSNGVFSVQFISGAKDDSNYPTVNITGSYWDSLHILFYGSSSAVREKSGEAFKFQGNESCAVDHNPINKQFLEKFHISGSIFSIPQKYFGESIKRKSFELVDNSTAKTITIKDDGYGNLYPVGNSVSQSVASPSSSTNYVGNIFYEQGIATITDTGSYSSSINYEDMGDKYKMTFKSTQTTYTHEYLVRIARGEFNYTFNTTARQKSLHGSNLHSESPFLNNNLTASSWKPYFTQIALYHNNMAEMIYDDEKPFYKTQLKDPVIIASVPRPIQVNPNAEMIFKIRLDQ